MKKILTALVVSLAIAVPAHADGFHHHHGGGGYQQTNGNWFGPLIGGMIIGGVLTNAARPAPVYSQGPVVIQQPAPVIVQQYEVRPQCRYENAFSTSGQYLGQIQVCN